MHRRALRAMGTVLLGLAGLFTFAVASAVQPPELFAQQPDDPFDFNNDPFEMGEQRQPSPAELMFVLFFYGIIIAVSLGITIFIIILLSGLLKALPQEYRLMEPGMVWLMLIPCFNIIWIFFVFVRIPKSYQNYFRARGDYSVGDCGESIGLWYAICVVLSMIPCVGAIAGIAALILLIVFLVKLHGLKGQVQQGGKPTPGMQF